eukprot:gene28735-35650_t
MNVIRLVSLHVNGNITLFAGTYGASSSLGNGGPATSGNLASPYGVIVGPGGPATSISMNEPIGVWGDLLGDVFICEASGSRIRKVTAVAGISSSVAGTGVSSTSVLDFNGDNGPATLATLAQ